MGRLTEENNVAVDPIEAALNSSLNILKNPKVQSLVEQVANLTVAYYKTLIAGGVPADHAATITASYSSQITALKP